MPALQYWVSGAAFAALLTFIVTTLGAVGAGYGWYRAAVSEMETANKDLADKTKQKEDAEAKNRQAEIEKALATFIVRGNELMVRLMDTADTMIESQSEAWNYEVMGYVAQTLGPRFAARLNSAAGITGQIQSAPTELRRKIYTSTYIRIIRLQEFLKEV